MAKKSVSRKTTRKGLFDTFENVKGVRQGESLRFRDKNGRLTKFDGRKKLIAEIWLNNKRTNRVLNKTKKGQPVPQKFDARLTKKRQLFLRNAKQGPRKASEPKSKKISIDARFTIADNIEAKVPEMLSDTVKYTKRGNGSYITIELTLKNKSTGENFYEVINAVIKSTKHSNIALDLARLIIHRLYRNEMRASSLKLSPIGRRGDYVRSFQAKFTWDETKSLKDL